MITLEWDLLEKGREGRDRGIALREVRRRGGNMTVPQISAWATTVLAPLQATQDLTQNGKHHPTTATKPKSEQASDISRRLLNTEI